MDAKMVEQSVDRKDRRIANPANGAAPSTTASTSDTAVVCKELQFRYVGDDGMALPGAHFRHKKYARAANETVSMRLA